MKRRLILLVLLLAALAPARWPRMPSAFTRNPGPGQECRAVGARIVAVVNDNVISSSDLNARIAMAFLSSGLPDTPEVRQRLLVQLLRSMIDEQLELQEAKKLEITVPQAEIDQALARISQSNNIPGGDMKQFLKAPMGFRPPR